MEKVVSELNEMQRSYEKLSNEKVQLNAELQQEHDSNQNLQTVSFCVCVSDNIFDQISFYIIRMFSIIH